MKCVQILNMIFTGSPRIPFWGGGGAPSFQWGQRVGGGSQFIKGAERKYAYKLTLKPHNTIFTDRPRLFHIEEYL
jgi:hypothetical protein